MNTATPKTQPPSVSASSNPPIPAQTLPMNTHRLTRTTTFSNQPIPAIGLAKPADAPPPLLLYARTRPTTTRPFPRCTCNPCPQSPQLSRLARYGKPFARDHTAETQRWVDRDSPSCRAAHIAIAYVTLPDQKLGYLFTARLNPCAGCTSPARKSCNNTPATGLCAHTDLSSALR